MLDSGVINHGERVFTINRTFHNVRDNANMQLHSLLLDIERVYLEKGFLPPVLYFQIDGGSENIAKHVYGMIELLVAKGLFKKIVVTRLPVVSDSIY